MSDNFRLQARYVLLTYSQCGDLDPWLVCERLATLHAECLIGRETHRDGGFHLHAFVDFGKKVDLRDSRLFDIGDQHPNIAPCGRTPQKMLDYAVKDGDIVAGGLPLILGDEVSSADTLWHRIANAATVDEFWDLVRELAPRALLCNHQSLRAYAEWHYRPPTLVYQHPRELRICADRLPELDEWVRESLSGAGGRPRSLILWGESKLGKTIWARSLGKHIYCCMQFNVDDVKADLQEAQYAIFDDIQGNFQFFPSYKGWLGAQHQFTVTDKYKGKTTINWGRPSIWLSNDDPEEVGHVDLNWLRKNCVIVKITESIVELA
uniref:Replication-associated protein n=1 Tax=Genomoviridae sp. TaxID=2202565 RepID=A0A8F5MKG1_9VIRU|nr:MAG: replication associated protein [Genomoviridae sp.]